METGHSGTTGHTGEWAARSGRTRALLAWLAGLASLLVLLWLLLDGDARLACTASVPDERELSAVPAPLAGDAEESTALARLPTSKARDADRSAPPAGPEAIVQGRVLDARTREAVPGVEVVLFAGNVQRSATTDAGGWFEARADFPRGTITARVRDGSELVGTETAELDPAAGLRDWIVSVPIGPTVPIASIDGRAPEVAEVEVDGEPGAPRKAAPWEVRLVESSLDPELAGVLRASRTGIEVVQPDAKLPDREWPWLPVRPGFPPFVRYAQQVHPPDERYRVRVEVRGIEARFGDDRGLIVRRVGWREVPRSFGIQPRVALVTSVVVVVKGRILSHDRRPFARAPFVVFTRGLGRSSEKKAMPGDAQTVVARSNGAFESPPLPVDEIDLVVFAEGHAVKTVRLDELGVTRGGFEIELDPAPPGFRSILPPVPSERRAVFAFQLFVAREARLRDLGPTYLLQSGRDDPPSLDWTGLPAGEYTLEPIGMGFQAPWRGVLEAISLPRFELGALGANEPRAEPFRFRAVNATDGGDIKRFSVVFGPAGSLWRAEEDAWSVDFALDDRAPLAWTVWADGYAPGHGTERDFVIADGARVATARLQRGFGAELEFRHRPFGKGGAASKSGPGGNLKLPMGLEDLGRALRDWSGSVAVSNVRVLGTTTDELDVTSGADGIVRFACPSPPPVLRVQREGWRVDSVERQLDLGQRFIVWLKPR